MGTTTRTALLRQIDDYGSWREVVGLAAGFADRADLLRTAQQRWFTALGGAIDVAIETGGGDLTEDVREAYRETVRHHPGLRALLDEHSDHPAIVHAIRRERALLARAAGVAHSDEVTGRTHVPAPRRGLLQRVFATA